MEEITYRPIGIIRSPFKEPKGTPIQPGAAEGIEVEVEKIGWLEKRSPGFLLKEMTEGL